MYELKGPIYIQCCITHSAG